MVTHLTVSELPRHVSTQHKPLELFFVSPEDQTPFLFSFEPCKNKLKTPRFSLSVAGNKLHKSWLLNICWEKVGTSGGKHFFCACSAFPHSILFTSCSPASWPEQKTSLSLSLRSCSRKVETQPEAVQQPKASESRSIKNLRNDQVRLWKKNSKKLQRNERKEKTPSTEARKS